MTQTTNFWETIFAWTPPGLPAEGYVPYINISKRQDGQYDVIVRQSGSGTQAMMMLDKPKLVEMANAILKWTSK